MIFDFMALVLSEISAKHAAQPAEAFASRFVTILTTKGFLHRFLGPLQQREDEQQAHCWLAAETTEERIPRGVVRGGTKIGNGFSVTRGTKPFPSERGDEETNVRRSLASDGGCAYRCSFRACLLGEPGERSQGRIELARLAETKKNVKEKNGFRELVILKGHLLALLGAVHLFLESLLVPLDLLAILNGHLLLLRLVLPNFFLFTINLTQPLHYVKRTTSNSPSYRACPHFFFQPPSLGVQCGVLWRRGWLLLFRNFKVFFGKVFQGVF